MIESFPREVVAELMWYVYRLVDPRNGETFYVGKGKGDRIFHHLRGQVAAEDEDEEDIVDLKLKRIGAIRAAGLDVLLVIHRHHMDEEVAYQVEAAVIDAYPGLTNSIAGHDSSYYGARHISQILAEYAATEFVPGEPLILISIGKTHQDLGPYQAARAAWRINQGKAERYRLVLAHVQGVVVGVFRPQRWMADSAENFPWLPDHSDKRIGFVGSEADEKTVAQYLRKRVPAKYRQRGAANPCRYLSPDS